MVPSAVPPATFFVVACSALIFATGLLLFTLFFPALSAAIFMICFLWYLLVPKF